MAAAYPAVFDVARPERFQRPQVVLRILVLIILAILGGAFGWLIGLVYLVLPVISAIFISQKGPERFIQEDAPRVAGWLRWLVALDAYIALLTDRLPTERPQEVVVYEVRPAGSPTVGSALLRLIYSIPSAIVLALLSIVSGIIWIIALIMVLIQETYPQGLYNFQRGIVRWTARLLAYHASLVDQYPPYSLDTGPEPAPAASA